MLEYFIQKDLQTILVLLHKHNKKALLKARKAFINVGWEMGFEPTIFGTTIRRFNQLSYTHHISNTPLRCYIISAPLCRSRGALPTAVLRNSASADK